jgi:hypothetical protein
MAQQWAFLEVFAGLGEELELAEEAYRKVTELAREDSRPPPLLAMTAIGWAECANFERAGMYARRVLDDSRGVNAELMTLLRALAEAADD